MSALRNLFAACVMIVAIQPAFAGLVGKELSPTYRFPDLGTEYLFSSWSITPFTVGAGVETVGDIEGVTFPSVDFEDARLVVTLNTTLSSPTWNSAGFNGILFTLESAGTLGITGAGVTAATTMAGFDSARVTFSDTTVAIDWQGLSYVDGTQVVIDFEFVPVPEPAAYLLLLGGLLALGLLRRRSA